MAYVDEQIPKSYRVFFRSYGRVERSGSRLVSGVRFHMVDKHLWSPQEHAAAVATVGEQVYTCHLAGYSGYSWNDGNQFGYWIKTDFYGYEEGIPLEVLEESGGKITLTVSNLVLMETNRHLVR